MIFKEHAFDMFRWERRNTIGIEGIGEVNWQLGDVGRNPSRFVLCEQLGLNVRFTPESGDAIGMSALCQQQPLPSSLRSLSALWSAQSEITLGAEDVAVKACNPLPPPRGHIQVLNGGLDMRRNSFPIKLRV